MVLRVETASNVEKLKKMAKCSPRSGRQNKYSGSQMPVLTPSAAQVPKTNNVACKTTNVTTPTNLPRSKHQRGTGFTRSTVAEEGSRNAGKNPAVHVSAKRTPMVSAT